MTRTKVSLAAFRKAQALRDVRRAYDTARVAGQKMLGAERRYRAALDELEEKRARWLEIATAFQKACARR